MKNSSRFLLLAVYTLLFNACISVKNHNLQIANLHSPEQLREDVDYSYRKLQKLHPRLYQFVSKEVLDTKFDSLKKSIKKPGTSKEFYQKLSPVIAEVRQGHIAIGYPHKRFTRKRRKALKKAKLGFNEMHFEFVGNTVLISNAKGQDSILIGSEVIKIDSIPIKELFAEYKKRFSSDGYNTTFQDKFIARWLPKFYYRNEGFLDSISLLLKNNDSTFVKNYRRVYKKNIVDKGKNKDSLLRPKKVNFSKEESRTRKLAYKRQKKEKRIRGYIKSRDTFTRNFSFVGSNKNVALIKILSWNNGPYKKFYKSCFQKMDSLNTEFLILDLRDNTGGRLKEIERLYSYLVDRKFQFVKRAEVNTRVPYLKNLYRDDNLFSLISSSIAAPFLVINHLIHSTKKNGQLYLNYSSSRTKNPNPLNFKGIIYVITNGNSFSASSILSTNLKATNRAIFVGEETGGGYNGSVAGQYKTINLPNSKVRIRFGLMHIQSPYEEETLGRGIRPDKSIEPTISDRMNNVDPELNWILDDIGN